MKKMFKYFVFAQFLLILTAASCARNDKQKIIVFHAGSLSVPFKKLKTEFEKSNPRYEVLLEASGSVEAARKVSDLGKACDIVASADYQVIDEILIPKHAEFNVAFASNKMAIVFTGKSRFANEINSENWYDVLGRKNVKFAHSDPDKDPCGYRTLLVWKLAEKHYKKPGMYESLKKTRDEKSIRPKETDLIALVEAGALDYIFLYKSVAVQHKLKFIELPPEIDLSDSSKNRLYSGVSVKIRGKKPGETIEMKGAAMLYSAAMINYPPNRVGAIEFLNFIFSKEGAAIIESTGQPAVYPAISKQKGSLPPEIEPAAAQWKD